MQHNLPFKFIAGWKAPVRRVVLSATCCLAAAFPALANTGAAARWAPLATVLSQPVAQDDQLPNAAIPMAVASDAQGFLWVGTQNGLARWDGQRFRIFNSDSGAGALPDSQIECLLTDRESRFWIGTLSGGLALYDRATGGFKTYRAGPKGLSHAAVHALVDAPGGRLWVGTEAGLNLLDPRSDVIVQEAVAAGPAGTEARKALAEGVYALVEDRGGDLWIGTHGGLVRRDHGDGSFAVVPLGGHLDAPINALMLASDGRLWVGAEGRGAFVVNPANRRSQPVPGSMAQTSAARATVPLASKGVGMRVRALLEPTPGVVWLGTYDDGVIEVDPANLSSRRVRLGASNVLYGDQNIRAMNRSPDGLVFIAANSAITRYDPHRQAFSNILGGLTPTAVLTGRNAVSLFEAPDHRVWISQMTRGVDLIDAGAQHMEHRDPSPGGLPKASIRSYAVLPDRSLLLGTDAGLFRSSLDARRVQRLDQPGRLPDSRAQALLRDGLRLWLGGRDGLWAYKLGQGGRLAADLDLTERLSDRRIDSLALDRLGDLWVATDNGLNRVDPRTGAVRQIKPVAGDQTTPHGFISSLTLDSRGRLWVSTFGEGLFMITPGPWGQAMSFRRVSTPQGLPNDNVNQTLEDDHGGMWASTDSGLARIDPEARRAETFRLPEGVAISSFFYNSGVRTSHGELLFGGRDGLALVRPNLVRPMTTSAPLVVTEVREGGRPMPGDPFAGLESGDALTIPPGVGALEVHFAALDYAAPDRMHYAYRLQRKGGLFPSSAAWIDADSRARVAAFTNMAPGRYSLEIRAFDPEGAAGPRTLELPIKVLPAWWQTIWFSLLEVVAGLGVVLLLIWSRTAYLHRQRVELEHQVEERTRDLAQARARAEDLARTTTDFLANMSHEIRTPLNGVVAVADLLARSNLKPKEREMAEIIRASGDTLQRLLSDILDAARIQSGKISIEDAAFQAGDMVRAVAGLWQLKCDEKGVKLRIVIAPDFDQSVMGDLARVRQILTNLLSNAVKFTEAGEIRLTAERVAGGGARFTVTDSGIGFAPTEKGKVLGRFEQADSSITRRYGGTGLGLSICCDLATLMGGKLDCDSVPGKGSRFWLDLPLEPVDMPVSEVAAQTVPASELGEETPLRILVADDHPTNRKVVQLMLEACGAELTEAENGAEALEAFRGGGYDLVLMDMQMPVMDGLAAVTEIRRLEASEGARRTPIIMLTANALPEHIAKAHAAGADLHLAKPLTSASLFEALNTAMAVGGAEFAAA